MAIKDAIQRLGWRFKEASSKQKGFIPNENDINAFNELVDFYEKTKADNYQRTQLAFKMYVWHRVEMMKHYDTDIFDLIPQRVLAEALCQPSKSFVNRLTEYLNEKELKIFTSKDPDFTKNPFLMTGIEKLEATNILKKQLDENPELFDTLVGKVWTNEDVEENIIAEFNQLLQIAS